MAYCGPRGIPLDAFLSWPQESQDAAIQWAAQEARRCHSCGTLPDEWIDDQGARVTPVHYHPQVCLGCQAREAAESQLRSDKDLTRGLHIVAASGPASTCPVCNG